MTKQLISANLFCRGEFFLTVRSSDLDLFGGRVLISTSKLQNCVKGYWCWQVHLIWVTDLQCCPISLLENKDVFEI